MPNYMYQKKTNVKDPAPVTQVPPKLNDALGRGMAFPLTLTNNRWKLKKGVDKVKQDIFLTLAIPVGRLFLYPSFGSMLPYWQFKMITVLNLKAIAAEVQRALTAFVPYIVVNNVVASQISNVSQAIGISIDYSITSTQSSENLFIVMNDIDNIAPSEFVINGKAIF